MDVVVSAPGKVLITGGYLVLEQPNSGLVVSTSARFFAIVKPLNLVPEPDSWAWSWTDVKVFSPQLFRDTTYKLSLRDFTLKQINEDQSAAVDGANPFVENAIQLAIAAAKAEIAGDKEAEKHFSTLLLQGLSITIMGNNAFYSFRQLMEAQSLPITADTLASVPEFSPISLNPFEPSKRDSNGISLPEVAKTGLGSSAAMTAAVVGAVLEYLGGVKLPRHGVANAEGTWNVDLVHSIAQAAHSAAQGKIGSGFDISAAVYGSQRYVRFSPSILSYKETRIVKSPVEKVDQLLKQTWDGEQASYALPPQLLLIIGEPGYGGSHTPSMVNAVTNWRKKDPEQEKIISALGSANKGVEKGLAQLNELAQSQREAFFAVIESCSTSPAAEWEKKAATSAEKKLISALLDTRSAFEQVRSGLRTVGERAGVPIEPDVQTELLDQTMAFPGVLFAGVPGAGGYDAVFAITLGMACRDRIVQEWDRKGVLTLPTNEDPCGVALEGGDPRTGNVGLDLHSMTLT